MERLNQFTIKTDEAEKEKVKAHRGKRLRAFALASMVGGAALTSAEEAATPYLVPAYVPHWDAIQAETMLDLRPLEHTALAKVEVPGERYVIHLAQNHGGMSLEATKKVYEQDGLSLEQLIECQKQIEETILYLNDRYGIRVVYEEGLSQSDAEYYSDVFQSRTSLEVHDALETVQEYEESVAYETPGFFDKYTARDLLIAEKALAGTEYAAQASMNELIGGDARYIWGASFMLALDGTIELRAAEDPNANAVAVEKGLASTEGLSIRENAALDMLMREDSVSDGSFVLVYGAGHDFTDEVRTLNDAARDPLGLIRIDPKACVTS